MKINITKKQYKQLMDLVYLGEWMANSNKADISEEYEKVFKYIGSFAKEFGYKNIMEYDPEFQSYFPTLEYEDEMQEIISDYDETIFWEDLAEQLAKRDIDEMQHLLQKESYTEAVMKREEMYVQELMEHGLKRIGIKK